MFREILNIIPRIPPGDLNRMETSLNARFARVGKRFGKGLVSALKGGGVVGAALGLLEKLLNPFDAIKQTIEGTISRSDDIKTMADQFKTTSGNLAKLQAFGKATDLDPNELNLLIGKFQASIAEAIADPTKVSPVRQFTGLAQKDTGEAFFQFIQSLKKLGVEQQIIAQQDVFGEKQIGKMSEFLNANFKELASSMNLPSSDQMTQVLDFGAQMSDANDLLAAQQDIANTLKTIQSIGPGMINGLSDSRILADDLARKDLAKFDAARKADVSMAIVMQMLKEALFGITNMSKALDNIQGLAERLPGAKALRGVKPFGKGD